MISFVIPALQEEKYLSTILGELRSIRDRDIEIIISDGGSTDRTVAIAEAAGAKVVRNETSIRSGAKQRNDGARTARGDIIVFVDADCTLADPNGFVERIRARMDQEPDLTAIAVPQRVARSVRRFTDVIVFETDNLIVRFMNNVLHHGAGSGKCIVVRADAFRRASGFDERLVFWEDAEFMGRISKIGRTHFDGGLKVYHSGRRIHRIGPVRFLWGWVSNGTSAILRDKAIVDEWTPVR